MVTPRSKTTFWHYKRYMAMEFYKFLLVWVNKIASIFWNTNIKVLYIDKLLSNF